MKYFLASLLAIVISFILTFPTIKLANKLKLIDDPEKRKHPAHTHQGIVPRAGGLPIYLSFLTASLIFVSINKILIGILIGGFLIIIMGLLDDYYDLSPYWRFVFNIIIALIVISFGLGIPYLSNPLGGVIDLQSYVLRINLLGERRILYLADLFSIIWIVALMNFVNWSKGVDGQLPGFVAISSFFLGLIAFRFVKHDITVSSVALLCFIAGGSYLGFLPWNFYPQKIMPGYGGGAFAGYILAILSILSWGKFGTLILVLSIPLIDALYVLSRRIISLKSPFRADDSHFHHRLLRIGWGRRRIAVFYWLVSFLFGSSALFFQGIKKFFLIIVITFIIIVFIFTLNQLELKNLNIKNINLKK